MQSRGRYRLKKTISESCLSIDQRIGIEDDSSCCGSTHLQHDIRSCSGVARIVVAGFASCSIANAGVGQIFDINDEICIGES
jgi:hypothetical protein